MVKDLNSELKAQWRKKSWSIPDLPGGKQHYFPLIKTLVEVLANIKTADLDDCPDISHITSSPRPWRDYAPLLRGVNLAYNQSGLLCLTDLGRNFLTEPSKSKLADIFQDNFKLFGEVLAALASAPATVQEVNEHLCASYNLDWGNCANTRRRMDWLETFELITALANHKWQPTEKGLSLLKTWDIVTPDIYKSFNNQSGEIQIEKAPAEIDHMLQQLKNEPSLHLSRSKYNICVPSPNRIDNLRTIATFCSDAVSREDLYSFIEHEFDLKRSSVDSMMPFLKVSDLISETGRGVYTTTPAAKAWCQTANDLDFVRILHCNMRFVGEMIAFCKGDTTRNEVYEYARAFGQNREKARQITGFLIEAGLLEEPRYLHLKATPLGMRFLDELPLADSEIYSQDSIGDNSQDHVTSNVPSEVCKTEAMFQRLSSAARDPFAENDASGAAFEKAIAEVLSYAGFDVKRIGGSGDTDVLVRWKDSVGNTVVATIDGKSKSTGTVSHSDISDIALETHREKHNAKFTAIVGPGFGGDTIEKHANKKGFALITDDDLAQITETAHDLGLNPEETALIFQTPNGLSQFEELVAQRQRRMNLITLAIATFREELDTYGSLSARDLSLLLRNTELAPSVEELIAILELLASPEIHVLTLSEQNKVDEYTTYTIINEKTAAWRLSAIAKAIERGVEKSS